MKEFLLMFSKKLINYHEWYNDDFIEVIYTLEKINGEWVRTIEQI